MSAEMKSYEKPTQYGKPITQSNLFRFVALAVNRTRHTK